MPKKQPTKPATSANTVAPEIRRRSDFASHYVNHTGIQTTPWDISLFLGRIVDAAEGKIVVDQFAQLSMSPQHAQAVLDLVGKALQHYENTYGPIPRKGFSVGDIVEAEVATRV